jgi:hypothetical protein
VSYCAQAPKACQRKDGHFGKGVDVFDSALKLSIGRVIGYSTAMRFARVVFSIAAIWGVLVLTPLYFIFDRIGRQDPPAITHPGFYYGFVGAGLAWQVAFLIIAGDPLRFRAMMLAGVIEKFSYAIAMLALYFQSRVHPADLTFAGADLLFGMLFIAAYLKTGA